MTVADLIAKLKTLHPDLPVMVLQPIRTADQATADILPPPLAPARVQLRQKAGKPVVSLLPVENLP